MLTTGVDDRNVMTCGNEFCTSGVLGFEGDRRLAIAKPIVNKKTNDIFLHGSTHMYVCDAEKDWTEGAGRSIRKAYDFLGTRCKSRNYVSLPSELTSSSSIFGKELLFFEFV